MRTIPSLPTRLNRSTRSMPLTGPSRLARLGTAFALAVLVTLVVSPRSGNAQDRGLVAEDYYRMTFVGDVALHPAGDFVAFTVTTVREAENDRHREVWLAPLRGGAPHGEPFRFTDPTRSASSPRWSPDGSLLSFQSKRGDGSETWFARVGGMGGEAFRIDGVEGAPTWSPDGAWIAFLQRPEEEEPAPRTGWIAPDAITRTLDASRFDGRVITHPRYKTDGNLPLLPHPESRPPNQLFVVPSDGGEARQITETELDVTQFQWTPDGQGLVFSSNPDQLRDPFSRNSQIYRASVASGEVRQLSSGPGLFRFPAVAPDGRRMALVWSPDTTSPSELQVVDLDAEGTFTGTPRTVSEGWDDAIGEPTWTPNGQSLRFGSGVRGSVHLWEVSAGGGSGSGANSVRPVTQGERQVADVDRTADGSLLAYTSTDAHTPAEVFVSGADGSGEVRITGFNDSWLTTVLLNPAREITWQVADGTQIQGWVIPPVGHDPAQPGSGRFPLVMKAHGGPNGMYGHTFFQTFHTLSATGFFVFYPNPRGSTGYGHDFMQAIQGSWGLVDEEDFLTGLDAVLAAYPEIDPARVGIAGGSYGGYVTNWLTARSDRFAAAVTSRSITNLENLWGTSDALGLLDTHFLGTPWEEQERYRLASPIHYVQNVTAPTLIIHSEQDHRTPMQDGEQWFMSLQVLGVPSEFVRYPRSSHGLSRTGEPWLLVDRLTRLQSWFEHWLLEAGDDH